MKYLFLSLFSFFILKVSAFTSPILHFSVENKGHSAPVRKILHDRNRHEIISVSEDKSIGFWDDQSFDLKEIVHFNNAEGHNGVFYDAVFSLDSNFIYVVGDIKNQDSISSIIIINLNSRKISENIDSKLSVIKDCHISQLQYEFIISSGTEMEIFSIQNKHDLVSKALYTLPFEIKGISSNSLGDLFLASSTEKSVVKIQVEKSKIIKTVNLGHHYKSVTGVYCSGKFLYSVGDDFLINMYDSTGKFLKKLASVQAPISSFSISSDGNLLLVGEENSGKIYVISIIEKSIVSHNKILDNSLFATAFCENKNGLFAICAGGNSHDIQVLNPSSSKLIKQMGGSAILISDLAFKDNKLYFNNQLNTHVLHEYIDFKTFKINVNQTNFTDLNADFKYLNPFAIQYKKTKIKSSTKLGRILSFCVYKDLFYVGTDYYLLVFSKEGKFLYKTEEHIRSVRAITACEIGNQSYLITSGEDGLIKFRKITEDKVESNVFFNLYINADRQWVMWSNLGYFVSSDDGSKLIGFQRKEMFEKPQFTTLDQFFDVLYKPFEISQSIFSGKPVEEILQEKNERVVDLSDIKGESYVLIDDFFSRKKIDNKDVIVYPKPKNNAYTTPEAEIELVVSAVDGGAGIKEINILCNGKLIVLDNVFPNTVTLDRVKRTYTINLIPGKNHIEIFAVNFQKRASIKQSLDMECTADVKASTNLFALLIGINNYKNPKNNLNYARDDAESVKNKLSEISTGIFNKTYIETLFDENATKENIMKVLTDFSVQANPNDVFVFYYAGHGVMNSDHNESEYYLIPHDVIQLHDKKENLQKLAFSASEIKLFLSKIKAQKQLILLDACHSGGALKTLSSTRGAPEEKAIFQLARSSGIVLISASETEQFATEFKSLGHGVFTYTLLEALGGKADGGNGDKKLTVNELKVYMEDHVPLYSQKYGGKIQYPTGFSSGQDFPIGVVK